MPWAPAKGLAVMTKTQHSRRSRSKPSRFDTARIGPHGRISAYRFRRLMKRKRLSLTEAKELLQQCRLAEIVPHPGKIEKLDVDAVLRELHGKGAAVDRITKA